MKQLKEYAIPIEQRKDFLDYKKSHPEINAEEFVKSGLLLTMEEYDYVSIVRDMWKEHNYPSKLNTVALVMQFGGGHLNLQQVVNTFNQIKDNSIS